MRSEYFDPIVQKMKPDVAALFTEWWNTYSDEILWKGIPYPLGLMALPYVNPVHIKRSDYLKRYQIFMSQSKEYNLKSHAAYAELYKILAFHVYGFGNWSNNDRRRNKKPSLRRTSLR